jgi:hypothetical protein
MTPSLCLGSAPALNYELDILHGFDVTHGEDYVLHEKEDDELDNPGEPYVGSLPLECIAKCVADTSCHGALPEGYWARGGRGRAPFRFPSRAMRRASHAFPV